MRKPKIRAGVCCEICRENYEFQNVWGLECPVCYSKLPNINGSHFHARFCFNCLQNHWLCPQCNTIIFLKMI